LASLLAKFFLKINYQARRVLSRESEERSGLTALRSKGSCSEGAKKTEQVNLHCFFVN